MSIFNNLFRILVFLAAGMVQPVIAEGPISFAPQVPSPWVIRVDQKIPPQKGLTGQMVALANTNKTMSVVFSLTRFSKGQDKGFKQNARNHFGGFIDGCNPDGAGKLLDEKFEVKTVGNRQIAEASCRISFSTNAYYFRGNCWVTDNKLISWDALKVGAPVEDNDLQSLTGSLRVNDK